jgi:cation transport ATPase
VPQAGTTSWLALWLLVSQAVADRIASVFVPVVVALASLVLAVWMVLGYKVLQFSTIGPSRESWCMHLLHMPA